MNLVIKENRDTKEVEENEYAGTEEPFSKLYSRTSNESMSHHSTVNSIFIKCVLTITATRSLLNHFIFLCFWIFFLFFTTFSKMSKNDFKLICIYSRSLSVKKTYPLLQVIFLM